jgi:ppGpp synthetase/RelA/SpoT-type nucleotidyltranferase
MYPYSSVVSNIQDKCIRITCSHEQDKTNVIRTDTFVLYVTDYTGVRIYLSFSVPDYTGVRIYLSCMLLTTLEYGYIFLVCY